MPDPTASSCPPPSSDSNPPADGAAGTSAEAERKRFTPPRLRQEAALTRATAERSFRFGTASMS